MLSHLAPCTCWIQVDEEKGYRKFGGRPFVPLPVRDVPANMQVTAKQIRYKGEDNLKNIFAVRRGSSDSGTGQEK